MRALLCQVRDFIPQPVWNSFIKKSGKTRKMIKFVFLQSHLGIISKINWSIKMKVLCYAYFAIMKNQNQSINWRFKAAVRAGVMAQHKKQPLPATAGIS